MIVYQLLKIWDLLVRIYLIFLQKSADELIYDFAIKIDNYKVDRDFLTKMQHQT